MAASLNGAHKAMMAEACAALRLAFPVDKAFPTVAQELPFRLYVALVADNLSLAISAAFYP